MTKTPKLDFAVSYHIADCAAQCLSHYPPEPRPDYLTQEQHSNLRGMMRAGAVSTLRWLWRTGDADQRATVAARVHVWLGRKPHETQISQRVVLRERSRRARKSHRVPLRLLPFTPAITTLAA